MLACALVTVLKVLKFSLEAKLICKARFGISGKLLYSYTVCYFFVKWYLMVAGMSVKASEPRIGTSTHQPGKPSTGGNQVKAKPPVEAIQMARMLEETRYPTDISEKIKQVQAVVPNRSEEEICIALHDNDYDPEKAIPALLDSDVPSSGGEWTTSAGRKGKRKSGQNDGIELIVAPGDVKIHSKKGQKSFGTNRAAAQSTREGYGGSVHVSGQERGKGGRLQNGRGRSQSGRRADQARGKVSSGSSNDRRSKSSRDRGGKTTKSVHLVKPPLTEGADGVWDDALPVENDRGQEVTTGDWMEQTTWESAPQENMKTETNASPGWDMVDDQLPVQDELIDQPVFPEAIPTQQTGLQLSTPSETTPPLLSTPSTERDHTHPQLQERIEVQSSQDTPDDGGKHKSKRKQKRIARSQIPTQAVEMPCEGDTLDVQFGQLGIDFGGLTEDSSHSPSVAPGFAHDSLLTYNVHRLSDDPGVISVSTSTSHTPLTTISYRHPEQSTTDTTSTLGGPPGLIHPSSASHDLTHDRSLKSCDGALESHDHRLQIENSGKSAISNDQMTRSASDVPLTLSAPLAEPSTSESSSSVLQPPEPIEMPHQAQQKATSSSAQNYSVSGSEFLLSASTSHMSTSSTPLYATSTGSHQAGKQTTVPPGMMYPPMMPQYPAAFMPMYPTAAANYADPSELSRYQASVSMAYYPSGGADPALSAAVTGGGRDNYPNQDKYGRGSDVSPSISGGTSGQQTSQQGGALQQGQQMQPAFMNYPMNYPSNVFYPMYFPPAAAHSMAPKLSAGASSYPGVSSYQGAGGHLSAGSGYTGYDDVTSHDFNKMYTSSGGGSKSTNLAKSSSGEISMSATSYKPQPHYEGKTSSNYQQGYGLPQSQQYMGAAAYMQMPAMNFPHVPVLPSGSGHDSPGTALGAQKHTSKGGGYQSNYWGQSN